MTCTWEHEDGRLCGEPADAFRVRWMPKREEWWYCRLHIRVMRRLSSDRDALLRYGVATYGVL